MKKIKDLFHKNQGGKQAFAALVFFQVIVFTVCEIIVFHPKTVFAQEEAKNTGETKRVAAESQADCSDVKNQTSYKYLVSSGIKKFSDKLNQYSKCGYKLEKLTKHPLYANQKFDEMIVAAILKMDLGNRYEYEWFESFTPGDAVTRMNVRAKNGFYFKDILPVAQGLCENGSESSSNESDSDKIIDKIIDKIVEPSRFSLGNIYFLERKNAETSKNEYEIVLGVAGWGKNPAEQLQKEFDEKLRQNFQPVVMVSYKTLNNYAISLLMEKTRDTRPEQNSILEYKIIRSEFGFEKKVNALAKDGFQLKFVGEMGAFRHALMEKSDFGKTKQFSYRWIDAGSRSSLNKISNVGKDKFSLKITAALTWGCDSAERALVFERQNPPASQNSFDLQILSLTNVQSEVIVTKENIDEAISPSKTQQQQFTEKIKLGYIPQELFYGKNGLTVLFERQN